MDSATLATIVLLGGFAVLIFLRIPVTFSLLISTIAAALIRDVKLTALVSQMIAGVNNFTLLAIPFFILMGEIMGAGGISDKIIDLANLIVGRFRGGLAYVNCLSSMFFGGISGSAVADVSSLGTVVVPMMKKQGYPAEFSVGLTVTTACQGVLIPPSHNMVIYTLAAGGLAVGAFRGHDATVAAMFMAGVVPGILLGLALIIYSALMAGPLHFPRGIVIGEHDKVRWFKCVKSDKKFGWTSNALDSTGNSIAGMNSGSWGILHLPFCSMELGQCIKVIVHAILPMFTFIIILGGVTAGIFTATESAAIACVYTFIITYFVFRSAKLRDIGKVLKNCLKTLCVVMTLLACAKAFAFMMTDLRIPSKITTALISVSHNKIVLLLIINLLLLVLGCFMDMAPLIMIMTPILVPVVTSDVIEMSPVQFGVMLIFNLAVGLCTPPVGTALFLGCAIGKTSLERTSVKMLGMFTVMVIALLLITFVPAFSMWLPQLTGTLT